MPTKLWSKGDKQTLVDGKLTLKHILIGESWFGSLVSVQDNCYYVEREVEINRAHLRKPSSRTDTATVRGNISFSKSLNR